MSRRRKSKDEESAVDRPSKRRGIRLQDTEDVFVEAIPSRLATGYKYLYTFGLYGIWRKRNTSVVTNRRIVLSKGIFNREERSIPISRIEGVRFTRRGIRSYARLQVNDRGIEHTETVGPLSARAAREFIAQVLDRI